MAKPASAREPSTQPQRAKVLPACPAMASSTPELVPARMINEALYCERLMYLEWAQAEFADNEFTVEGRSIHRRADRAKALPPPPWRRGASREDRSEDDGDDGSKDEDVPYTARSVWLSSDRLGITSKIDVVDVDGGTVLPIEYKRGHQPDVPEGAHLPERAQVCAQVLLLREHGFRCDEGAIFFARDHRRVRIDIDAALVDVTLEAARRAREVAGEGVIPPPLEDSPKCRGCSLVGICLPDEVTALRRRQQGERQGPAEDEDESTAGAGAAEPEPVRRLHPARDDKVPLYVQRKGAKVVLSGERLRVLSRNEEVVEARLPNTSQISLLGNVEMTSPALRSVLARGIPVAFFSYGGWYVGRAISHDTKNVELRLAQYAAATDPGRCLCLARGFVASKIRNCRTLLRRNHPDPSPVALSELRQLARKATAAPSIDSLLGTEGTAARAYFAQFGGMLRGAGQELDLDGRNRRPPRDPANALLSFCYALLTKDVSFALAAAGLEPMIGFYHQPRFGRPSLALDLMEEFRPLIADSTVLTAVNTTAIRPSDFIRSVAGTALTPRGRRQVIAAYERRMDQLVTHPVFGYRISYRRVLEVQARLLGRVLLGELEDYPSFRTR